MQCGGGGGGKHFVKVIKTNKDYLSFKGLKQQQLLDYISDSSIYSTDFNLTNKKIIDQIAGPHITALFYLICSRIYF
jgi:hypothetical protein